MMSQPTVASYFNTRKRAAIDHLGGASRNKVLLLESPTVESIGNLTNGSLNSDHEDLRFVLANTHNFTSKNVDGNGSTNGASSPDSSELGRRITRASRAIKRIGPMELDEKTKALLSSVQPKLVSFVKKGNLSPQKRVHDAHSPLKRPVVPAKKAASPKKAKAVDAAPASAEFSPRNNIKNVEKAAPSKAAGVSRMLQLGKDKDALSLEEIRAKLLNHPRLPELKTKLNNIQSGLDKMNRLERERLEGRKPVVPPSPGTAAKNLQKFATLDVEVLMSPKKTNTSPSKILRTPTKNSSDLTSHATNVTPKRLSALMSPIKEASTATPVSAGSPKKLPAYQRFHALAEAGTPALQLPYRYRALLELFKCTDTVCAMFHNRKEQITFKKLKPAVQRMARKNFYESHLAQIQFLYPDAFLLSQEMTKNYGSATKHDTYQLVVRPNVEEKEDPRKAKKGSPNGDSDFLRTLQNHSMNPQVMTERYQRFHRLLLERVKDAHQTFLLGRVPPLKIAREQVRRWHAEFNLESCPEIEQAVLPQPPNVERFASAKDVLSTARNLFNCGTTMERALERLEEKKRQAASATGVAALSIVPTAEDNKPDVSKLNATTASQGLPTVANDVVASVLKNVPKALLEKIRAKQAAKALDQMTRRPSQDKEAMKYSRLPEIARHLRNVFVTERKNVLPLEAPLLKIENSYRGKLTLQELEEHIRMIAQLVPSWLTLPEVRKVKYVKVAKDCDLAKVISILERKANEAVQ